MKLQYNKDIVPKDDNRDFHGYVELWDNEDDQITQRGIWRHGRLIGYHEWHSDFLRINSYTETEYYIK